MTRSLALCLLALASTATAADPKPQGFAVTYPASLAPGPISARVYVMLGPSPTRAEPRNGPDWFRPQPFFAVDAKGWKPGEPLRFDDAAAGFPGPLSTLAPGKYSAQAVIRLNPDTHSLGNGEGNAYGPIVAFTAGEAVDLTVDKIVAAKPFAETATLKLVDIPSPILSAFHGRPIRHRAAVVLPVGESKPRAALYIIPGFGGDHTMAAGLARGGRMNYAKDLIRVVLNPDCGTGHHVFADSANNGPRGRALIEELIPHIEKTYNAIPEPRSRLLNGHSSGGWSSLWLQVTYPDYFGGTWSTSPDPVDFRDYQRINLYAKDENTFLDRQGQRRPLARRAGRAVLFVEDFARMEDVIGDGGQLHSFEAVFSPKGPDGRPRPMYDRKTGDVITEVAHLWEPFDIRLVLEKNWSTLGPKLAGKLHVITGDIDTFYLEGAVKLLKASLAKLGSDAVVEILPGKDHSDILDAELAARLDREMHESLGKGK